jgi:5'-3' exonuclease
MDGKKTENHRLKIFPEYKKHRIEAERPFDIGATFNHIYTTFISSGKLKSMLNINHMRVRGAEGDDIIGVLVRSFPEDTNIIIAKDKDFLQLTDTARLFDHRLKEITTEDIAGMNLTPKQYLMVKIMIGDGADGIPQVKPGMGIKRAAKIVTSKEKFQEFLEKSEPSVIEKMKLNRELIDLTRIPDEVKVRILTEYVDVRKGILK